MEDSPSSGCRRGIERNRRWTRCRRGRVAPPVTVAPDARVGSDRTADRLLRDTETLPILRVLPREHKSMNIPGDPVDIPIVLASFLPGIPGVLAGKPDRSPPWFDHVPSRPARRVPEARPVAFSFSSRLPESPPENGRVKKYRFESTQACEPPNPTGGHLFPRTEPVQEAGRFFPTPGSSGLLFFVRCLRFLPTLPLRFLSSVKCLSASKTSGRWLENTRIRLAAFCDFFL